jgi:hypothetical protein
MLRKAKRPLAGPWRGEPQVMTGRYSTGEYDGVTYEWVPNPDTPDGRPRVREVREDVRGKPAVSVNMNASRSGTRTFVDPDDLEKHARELVEAAMWLRQAIEDSSRGLD